MEQLSRHSEDASTRIDPEVAVVVRANVGAWHEHRTEWSLDEIRRGALREHIDAFGPHPPVYETVELETSLGVKISKIVPVPRSGEEAAPGIVFFHGGGFVICSRESHEGMARVLALQTGATVFSVEYRLAPEHPFPAAPEDAWHAFEWVAHHTGEHGVDPTRLAVAGDSAGGNLSAVVALRARDRGLALAAQLLIYPAVDLATTYPSTTEFGEGSFLDTAEADWFINQYLDGVTDWAHPDISPIWAASHAGLAPAILVVAECDQLRDGALAYAQKLESAGVDTTVMRFNGVPHAFLNYYSGLQRVRDAYEEICQALSMYLSTTIV